MAWRGVGWYRQRWPIAQFFRTLKQQGLQPEDSQRENAGRLIRLTAIAARAACIIMQRVQARDSSRRAVRPGARWPIPTRRQDRHPAPEIETLPALRPEREGKTALRNNPHPPETLGLGRMDHRQVRRKGRLAKIQTTRPDYLPPQLQYVKSLPTDRASEMCEAPSERRGRPAITISRDRQQQPGRCWSPAPTFWPDFEGGGPFAEACDAPRAYGRPHEFENRDRAAPTRSARRARNPLTAIEYLDRRT